MANLYQKDFWDKRYAQKEYVYGEQPNHFLKEVIDNLKPGKVILPAEGEGRNAVYAASIGWEVDAYDSSEKGKSKAESLAIKKGVSINYTTNDHEAWEPKHETYDLAVMTYAHCDPKTRKALHEKVIRSLKPGGIVLYEAFRKEQIELDTGGPKDIDMLLNEEILRADFRNLSIIKLEELEVDLSEGEYHNGVSRIIRMIAKK
ncbi:class I SAM-dependent methyltransferase [Ekhidna sp.]|uniref:class I SAM-dependent methyltransferase n=1 Tax=Ekhidna sp. TaxID=2608089 RepID=UPI003C7BF7DF